MTGPLILIVLGILLLLNNLYPSVYSFSRIWPVILIVIGVAKIVESIAYRRGGSPPPEGSRNEPPT
jgi:uncharacterized membrane protein HdeD (DUF308 family)